MKKKKQSNRFTVH